MNEGGTECRVGVFFFFFLIAVYPGKEKPICNNFIRSREKHICSNNILDSNWSFALRFVQFSSRQVFDTCHPLLLPSFLSGCCRRSSTFCVCSIFVSLHLTCAAACLWGVLFVINGAIRLLYLGDRIFGSTVCQDWTLTQQPFIPIIDVKLTC